MTALLWLRAHPRALVALLCLGLCGAAYSVGRYAQPPRVIASLAFVDRVQIHEVEKRVEVERRDQHKVTTRVIVATRKPDGETCTTTTEHLSSETELQRTAATERIADTAREVAVVAQHETTSERPQWRAGALVGYDGVRHGFLVGAQVERLLGPFSAGAWLVGDPRSPWPPAGGVAVSVEW